MTPIEIRMASNVAWHVRVNGPENVSEKNIRLMAAALEYLVDQRSNAQTAKSPRTRSSVRRKVVAARTPAKKAAR